MKTDYAGKLGKLLDRVTLKDAAAHTAPWDAPVLDTDQPLLNEFLRSYLVWEAGVPAARGAATRLSENLVDFNDLRVCMPDDLVGVLGPQYPLGAERAQRIRASLSDLCRRTHAVSMEHLAAMSKREAKSYVESLEGVPDFVSSRFVLVALGVHAMPMDHRTLGCLVEAGAIPEDATPEDAADQIQKRFKAGELLPVYLGLQNWADEHAAEHASGGGAGKRGKAGR